jgi:hypothetical protein
MKRLAAGLLLFLLCACASGPGQRSTARISLPSPPPTGEPVGYIGLTSAQLRATLGAPSFSRREYGSELWRYDTRECRAFFFLYPAGRDMSVRHVETVPHGRDVAVDANCLTALRARPASPVS